MNIFRLNASFSNIINALFCFSSRKKKSLSFCAFLKSQWMYFFSVRVFSKLLCVAPLVALKLVGRIDLESRNMMHHLSNTEPLVLLQCCTFAVIDLIVPAKQKKRGLFWLWLCSLE